MPTEEVIKKPRAPRKTATAKKPKSATAEEKEEVQDAIGSAESTGGSWIGAVGRRKTSIARCRLIKNGKGTITVNGRSIDEYFGTQELRNTIKIPLTMVGLETSIDLSASVNGGGIRGQAEAIRLGLCRTLIILNPAYRQTLKKMGYLTRDPRAKERKKFGLKKARRAPQWSKR
ncbi:30S ribosomal protein S9 [Candidatus Uhrbacteria bacterium]|nr:30S ribosomal protein S9 [Candidatus Uhrbacteria bacterium]